MYIGDKLEEIVQNFSKEEIMSNKKVNVEFDYEDLIHVIISIKEKESSEERLINEYKFSGMGKVDKLEEIKHKWLKDFPKTILSDDIDWLVKQAEKYHHLKSEYEFKQSVIDEKHRLQEQLEKGAIKVADLMFAYINKDEDFPHDFEIRAFEEGLYFLQEYYIDGKYNLRRFESYLNGMNEE